MEIVKAPSGVLRQKAKSVSKVTPDLLKIVAQMSKLASNFKDPEGVGLAAPQINLSQRFFIAKFGKTFTAFFNPKILSYAKEVKVNLEGCLSIPDYYGEVTRPKRITVNYTDIFGKPVTKNLTGTRAMIFQHECDHLEGKLFIDYVLSQKGRLFKVVGKDQIGADIFEEVNLSLKA